MLKPCHECEREISDQAPSCPHCGAPVATAGDRNQPPIGMLLGVGVLIVAAVVLLMRAYGPDARSARIVDTVAQETGAIPRPTLDATPFDPLAALKAEIGTPEPPGFTEPTGPREPLGRLKIERAWNDHGYMRVIVTFTNNTAISLETVRVQCAALTKNDEKVAVAETSLHAERDGPMKPGDSKTLTFIANLSGARFDNVSCEILNMQ